MVFVPYKDNEALGFAGPIPSTILLDYTYILSCYIKMQRPQRKPKLQSLSGSPNSPLDTPKTVVSLSGLPRSGEHYSRAPEFYGFVALTSTYLLFIIYLLWALLPDEYIVWLGVTWYPSR